MAYKTIENNEHGLLLQQIRLIEVPAQERDELEIMVKALYSRYHELQQQLNVVLQEYG